jgi:hypothetical protein
MAEPLLSRKKVIQVEIESAKGTANAVPSVTDVLVFEPDMKPTAPFQQRKGPGKYLGNSEKGIIEEKSGSFTCSAEMRGNGTNAMDTGLAVLLQACGLKNTAETYQVTSVPANHKTITIWVFEDGVKKILHGAMGNVTFEGETGKRLMCNFEFTGIWNAPTDAAIPAFAPSAEPPPILATGTFSIGAARKVSRFSLNMNNEVVLRHDINAASGIAHAVITDFDPVVGADLEADLVATYDINGIWLAGTEAAMSVVLGTGAGKCITFTIPKLQYREIPEGDRSGLQIYDITAQCNHSTVDDAVAIAVTTV